MYGVRIISISELSWWEKTYFV